MNAEPVWLSAHVFHHGDTDPMLARLVLPLFDDLRGRGLAERHFYLRHWEGGPHLRVRIRTTREHADLVRAEAEDRIRSYLAAHPGPTDTDPDRLRTALDRLSMLEHRDDRAVREAEPPNTLRWIPYQPELRKYGGQRGVEVAEEVFHHSTLLAGEVVRRATADRARLGVALKLLLASTRALGLDAAQRRVFLRHYHERWRSYVADPALLAAWERQYESQRDVYAAMVAGPELPPAGRGIEQRWEALMAAAVARLRPSVRDGILRPGEVPPGAPVEVALASLVSQFLHTNNNRMNVRPQGECFVAFLAHRAAEDADEQPVMVTDRS